jgi:hypothetical protein
MSIPNYTHVGYLRETSHVHTGRLYGHADYRGRSHALNGTANTYSGAVYRSLCGREVIAEHDGESFNVRPSSGQEYVSCARCRKAIKAK